MKLRGNCTKINLNIESLSKVFSPYYICIQRNEQRCGGGSGHEDTNKEIDGQIGRVEKKKQQKTGKRWMKTYYKIQKGEGSHLWHFLHFFLYPPLFSCN